MCIRDRYGGRQNTEHKRKKHALFFFIFSCNLSTQSQHNSIMSTLIDSVVSVEDVQFDKATDKLLYDLSNLNISSPNKENTRACENIPVKSSKPEKVAVKKTEESESDKPKTPGRRIAIRRSVVPVKTSEATPSKTPTRRLVKKTPVKAKPVVESSSESESASDSESD
eukprot:TRINITY_DN7591_c0_g1_i1.p1 TRINITY_DN7591_c0_g1~~TRINITY_DN7591_c0_g1_i1.p1  ORF type:complete len:168 (+),score=19.71 TRINITY_DN7591_c0_g1_i1:27-530(+)